MSEPTPLDKAEQAVKDAAANTDVVRIVAAVLATQQATQDQPAPPPTTPAPRRMPAIPASYIALAIVGTGAVTALAMAAALLAVAAAIVGVCATVCLLVLRSLYRDYQKNR